MDLCNLTLHMMTTFGSGGDNGSVYILNLGQPRERFRSANQHGQISHVASFDRTIWTSDCNPHKTQAVIGESASVLFVH